MRRPLSRLGVLLLSVALLATPSAALAPQPPTGAPVNADESKRLGDDAMVALRYEEALAHYRRAYEANKSPALLYNMGRAYEGLAEFPKALDALEEFSEKAPPELKARVPKLDTLLGDLRKRVATIIVSTSVPGAEVRLGNKAIGTTREGQTILRVNAGAQVLSVTHKDYFPFEKSLPLLAGKIETVDVQLSSRSAGALLVVTSPISGAEVSVDGVPSGNVPTEVPTRPGQHRVSLRHNGYDPAETSVVLVPGERKQLDLTMSVHETLAGKWWFWTGLGVLATAGVVVAVVAFTNEKPADKGTIAPGTVKAEAWGIRF